MRLFKKQRHNQDSFKRLIHRLSGMSEADSYKVNQLLDVVFDSTSQSTSDVKKAPQDVQKEPTLDETITEAFSGNASRKAKGSKSPRSDCSPL